MSNRTKIILLVILAIVLLGLIVRSISMLKTVSAPKPAVRKEPAKAPELLTTQPSPKIGQASPQQMVGLSLALPPRNPFTPLVSEKKETPPPYRVPSPPTPPPHLPPPRVKTQVPPGQPQLPIPNLLLMGTVIGPQRVAIIKIGEKSLIVRQGEKIDGLKVEKVERGRVIFEGGEVSLKGGPEK